MRLSRSGSLTSGSFRGCREGWAGRASRWSVVHFAERLACEFLAGEHFVGVGAEAAAEETAEPFEDEEGGVGVGLDDVSELVVVDGPDVGAFDDLDIGAGLLWVDHVHFADGFAWEDGGEFEVGAVGVAGDLGFAGEEDGESLMGFALSGEASADGNGGEAAGAGEFGAEGVVEFRQEAERRQHVGSVVGNHGGSRESSALKFRHGACWGKTGVIESGKGLGLVKSEGAAEEHGLTRWGSGGVSARGKARSEVAGVASVFLADPVEAVRAERFEEVGSGGGGGWDGGFGGP